MPIRLYLTVVVAVVAVAVHVAVAVAFLSFEKMLSVVPVELGGMGWGGVGCRVWGCK